MKHRKVREGCSFILLKKNGAMRPAFNSKFTLKRFLFNLFMLTFLSLRKRNHIDKIPSSKFPKFPALKRSSPFV